MTPIQRIRAETGMSASEAIKIHAEQGCSKLLTASTLGVCIQTLYCICDRFDLHKHFKPQSDQNESCGYQRGENKKRGYPKGKKRNRPPKYSDDYLLSMVTRFETSYKFEHHTELSSMTVIRRFGSWAKAVKLSENLTEKGLTL